MRCYTAQHRGDLRPRSKIAEIAWVTGADLDRVTHAELQVMARLVADGLLQVDSPRLGYLHDVFTDDQRRT